MRNQTNNSIPPSNMHPSQQAPILELSNRISTWGFDKTSIPTEVQYSSKQYSSIKKIKQCMPRYYQINQTRLKTDEILLQVIALFYISALKC